MEKTTLLIKGEVGLHSTVLYTHLPMAAKPIDRASSVDRSTRLETDRAAELAATYAGVSAMELVERLCNAARNGDLNRLQELIAADAESMFWALSRQISACGCNALTLAGEAGHHSCLLALIAVGADTKANRPRRATPLSFGRASTA